MAQVVEIPGVGRIEFPDEMSREDISAAVNRLAGGGRQAPPSRAVAAGLSSVMAPDNTSNVPGGFHPGLGAAAFETLLGPLPDDPEGFARETLPAIGATVGSMAVPPAAIVRGLPLMQRLARILPGVGAAGAGGAAGGALGALLESGDIDRAAFQSGARMAGAEALGRGATGTAARVIAPAVGLLDDAGRRALEFARGTPLAGRQASGADVVDDALEGGPRTAILGRPRRPSIAPTSVAPGPMQKGLQSAADFLIPSRFVTQRNRRLVTEKVLAIPTDQQNDLLARLIRADTSDAGLTTAKTIADKVSKAIGVKQSSRFGFGDGQQSRQFINRLLREGDPAALRKRLNPTDFNEFLEKGLESLIVQSTRRTQGGRRVIDGETLFASWENLPDKVRNLYPEGTREAITSFAAFARASQRVPEAAEEGVLTFGPTATTAGIGLGVAPAVLAFDPTGTSAAIGGGIAALTAKSLMNPRGLLNRYLTSEKLGPEVARVAGRQITQMFPRRLLAEPEEDEPALGDLNTP